MGQLKKITFYDNVELDFAHLEEEHPQVDNIFVEKYKPTENIYTRSLVTFDLTLSNVSISSEALGYEFSVYKSSPNSNILTYVCSKSSGELSAIDYNVQNQKEYIYYVFKEDDEYMSKAQYSQIIKTCWWDYSISYLIRGSFEDIQDNTYRVSKDLVWLFQSNIETGDVSQTFNKTVYNNFSKYPQISMGESNYSSGSFKGLLGHVTKKGYEESADLYDSFAGMCASPEYKLLKDRKGHSYIIEITGFSGKILDETREQATEVSISWVEVDDPNKYQIIGV